MSNRPQDQLVFHRSAKPVVGEFTDRYGQTRIIHRNRSTRLAVARQRTTATIQLNRVAGVLIGQRIKRARLRRGFTLEQLCTRAGIVSATPKSRMWEIENSVRQEGIRLGTLYAIGVTTYFLIELSKRDAWDGKTLAVEIIVKNPSMST